MKSKILAMIMFLSLATSILAFAIHTPSANAADAVLSIEPTPVNKVPGDVNSFFDVCVNITGVTNLFGFDIKVTWGDNTLITLDNDTSSANTAALLDGAWGAGNWFLVKIESSGGGGGGGFYRYVALSLSSSLTGTYDLMNLHFQIKRSGNFALETAIHIDTFKLSDPAWTTIPATTADGLFHIDGTKPDLELALIDPNPSKPFEYCKTFEVEVYATHVTDMTDFDLTILFTSELMQFIDVDYWGAFGTGSFVNTTGSVQVTMPAGAPHTGDSLLLFALTFHVEFDSRIEHIWRTNALQTLPAEISVKSDVGDFSFVGGTIPITGITLPSPIPLTIHLIRGDVDCNGKVDVFDLRTVAAYYDQSTPVKYDLTMDDTIDIFDLVVVATNFGYGGP